MDKKFANLRFSGFVKAAASGAIVGALAPAAWAGGQQVVNVKAGTGQFSVITSLTKVSDTSSASLAVPSANITQGQTGFLGALGWAVYSLPTLPSPHSNNLAPYAYHPTSGKVQVSQLPSGATVFTGPAYAPTTGPTGLRISVQDWFAPPSTLSHPTNTVMRSVLFLQNTNATGSIIVSVANASLQGLRGRAIVAATSSGSAFTGNADVDTNNWLAFDANPASNFDDTFFAYSELNKPGNPTPFPTAYVGPLGKTGRSPGPITA